MSDVALSGGQVGVRDWLFPPGMPAPGAVTASPGALPLEDLLRTLWRQKLGPKAETTGAGLLDMGIGARRLVRLLCAIEDTTGVLISPTEALQLGRFEALADAVRAGGTAARSPLILLKAGGRGAPLYMISGGGGFILELVDTARRIEHDGPIYGLQLPGLDGLETPLTSIEAMAAYYVEHIVPLHRGGPYHLAGYSFGGLVAVEMTRLLKAAGKPVGFLGLLESNVHERHWPMKAMLRHLGYRFGVHRDAIRTMSPWAATVRLTRALRSISHKVYRRLRRAPSADKPIPVEQSAFYIGGLPPHLQQVRDRSIGAFEAYAPQPLDHPITLIKSQEGEPHLCDPVAIWKPLIAQLEVITVPGAHRTMIRPPYCGVLAAELSLRLYAEGHHIHHTQH